MSFKEKNPVFHQKKNHAKLQENNTETKENAGKIDTHRNKKKTTVNLKKMTFTNVTFIYLRGNLLQLMIKKSFKTHNNNLLNTLIY